jgi:hypothetical protein
VQGGGNPPSRTAKFRQQKQMFDRSFSLAMHCHVLLAVP